MIKTGWCVLSDRIFCEVFYRGGNFRGHGLTKHLAAADLLRKLEVVRASPSDLRDCVCARKD